MAPNKIRYFLRKKFNTACFTKDKVYISCSDPDTTNITGFSDVKNLVTELKDRSCSYKVVRMYATYNSCWLEIFPTENNLFQYNLADSALEFLSNRGIKPKVQNSIDNSYPMDFYAYLGVEDELNTHACVYNLRLRHNMHRKYIADKGTPAIMSFNSSDWVKVPNAEIHEWSQVSEHTQLWIDKHPQDFHPCLTKTPPSPITETIQMTELLIKENTTLIDGVDADTYTIPAFLGKITEQKVKLSALKDHNIDSQVINTQIRDCDKKIRQLVTLMDKVHGKDEKSDKT